MSKKFLVDILAKAGLIVEGTTDLQGTATAITQSSSDNSTKLATTAFVKNQGYAADNLMVHLAGAETITGVKTFSPTVTAALGLGRSMFVDGTITASANNNTLVGLDIAPVFDASTFTGVNSYAVRISGTYTNSSPSYIKLVNNGIGSSTGAAIEFPFGQRILASNLSPLVGGVGFAFYDRLSTTDGVGLNSSLLQFSSSTPSIKGSGNNGTLTIAQENGTSSLVLLKSGGNISFQTYISAAYTDVLRIFRLTGNILLQTGGTFTDAGYKLDVNGTARLQGETRLTTLAGTGDRMVVANSSGVLSTQAIPSLSAYVPTSRTLTINGTAYDLSADRAWTIEAGGSGVSTRTIQKFTSTSSQTTFTITGGYTVGMVDVFVNGIKIDNATDFTATNGTTVVLTDALASGQTVEVYKYGSQFIVNNGLRQKTLFSATAGQTTFTVNYSAGMVDVFYNGSKLDDTEYTATNGTSIVFNTACAVNDKVEVIAYTYTVGAFTGVGGSGTANYLTKWTASGTVSNSKLYENSFGGIQINNTDANGAQYYTVRLGPRGNNDGVSSIWYIPSNAAPTVGWGTSASSTAFTISTLADDVTRLTIASTGAATFSNSVTAVGATIKNPTSDGSTPLISFRDTSGVYLVGYLSFNQTTDMMTLMNRQAYSASGIAFGTNNTERMRITQSGTLLINRTSAQLSTSLFEVGGSTAYNGLVRIINSVNQGDVNHGSLMIVNTASYAVGNDASIGFALNNSSNSNLDPRASIGAKVSGSLSGDLVFNTRSETAYTEKMRVLGTGNIRFYITPTVDTNLEWFNTTAGSVQARIWADGNPRLNAQVGGSGGVYLSSGATSWTGSSDERLKDINSLIDGALGKIGTLRAVNFSWKSDDNKKENLGLIAQDVEKVFPQVVDKGKDGILGVRYTELVPVLVKGLQEEDAKVNAQELRIQQLEQEVITLKSQLGSN